MTFYFLKFATAAWGYIYIVPFLTFHLLMSNDSYALLAWIAEILRKEPEARSMLVAVAVTLVRKAPSLTDSVCNSSLRLLTSCLIDVGHATIPLRAWRVADSPRYPIGFPLAAAFGGGSIIAILSMLVYVRRFVASEIIHNIWNFKL